MSTIFIFTGFYLYVLKKVKKITISEFKKLLIVTGFLLLSYPAMLSYDIFNYLATAKVLFFYHENPYIVMPIEFIGDPLLAFMHAANKTALYGPAWIVLTGISFSFGLGGFVLVLYMLKLFIGIFYFATAVLLWKITKNVYSLILFSLHPLVLIETLVSSHNDIVMMFFALSGFYLLSKKRLVWAFIFLAVSVFIKYATIFLLPVFLYYAYKTLKKKPIIQEKIYRFAFFSMLVIFFLAPLREEIYPWYAIWFLIFLPLANFSKNTVALILIFTISLLFRYVPFMMIGTHFGTTPLHKWMITFVPTFIFFTYVCLKRIWLKK